LGNIMRIDAVPIGRNPPKEVNVIVEVPVGGQPIKYEMDKAAGTLFVDRFLYTSMRYPGNYGFIPHTLSDDGDPCDVLVANQRGIVPGAVIAVRPIGGNRSDPYGLSAGSGGKAGSGRPLRAAAITVPRNSSTTAPRRRQVSITLASRA
jgi:hypothetical protein